MRRKSTYVGEVYSASTEEYIKLRLYEDQILEDFQLGAYLTIIGTKQMYLCKLIEISTQQLAKGLAETNVALREVDSLGLKIGKQEIGLNGNPLFYNLMLKPLKTISITESNSSDIQKPEISEPQTIPPVFTRVRRTTKDDLSVFFQDGANKKYVSIGNIRGTFAKHAVQAKVELFQMQNLHSALFAKTGSGKTVLAKILVGHITAEPLSCAIVFDMHDEYGYTAAGGGTSGLKPYFHSNIYVMSVDPKKKLVDSHIEIPLSDVWVSDVKVSLNLSRAQESVMYTLDEHYGKQWLDMLLDINNVDQILMDAGGTPNNNGKVTGGEIRRVTLDTLRREVRSRITRLACFKPDDQVQKNSIETIVKMILQGRTVIINFGEYSDDPMVYALITNLISRRMFEVYKKEIHKKGRTTRQVTITIEEAHKFLNKTNIQSTFFGRFIREARKFKMGLMIVDQRPSKIEEEVLSQIGTLFIMQLTNAKDLRMLEEESEESISEYLSEIRRLNQREGIVLGRGSEFVQNFKIFDYTDEDLLKSIWGVEDTTEDDYEYFE